MYYHSNIKSLITGALFRYCLSLFASAIGAEGRKVLLLLENCIAHGNDDTMKDLTNVEVLFLPPNSTSRIQPCESGFIAALRVRYCTFQMERAFEISEEVATSDI